MAGGVSAIAGSAATAAAVPVVGWVIGGAIVLGAVGWGTYKLATKK
jgi:hypothetical protein